MTHPDDRAPAGADPEDLGFRVRTRKNGDVEILHHGRLAATLRGQAARDLLADLGEPSGAQAQALLARRTGNYKRGNEREASGHPRNRR